MGTIGSTRSGQFLVVALVCVCAAAKFVPGVEPAAPQDSAASEAQEKLRRAELTAARFLERFNETLDFGVPYRELYLSESEWHGGADRQSKTRRQSETRRPPPDLRGLDEIDEQLEVSIMNLWYLRAAYLLSHGGPNLPPEIKAARGEELFPYLEDLNHFNRKQPAVQRRKWQAYLNNTKRLADLYRRYLPPRAFASAAYQARLEEVDSSVAGNRPRARVEQGYNNYEEFTRRDVYKVLRGGVEYTLVEAEGAFKVIHINPLPGFRMSP